MKRQNHKLIGSALISAVFISIALIISILLARNQLHNDESQSDSNNTDRIIALTSDAEADEVTIFTPESSQIIHECLFDVSLSEPTCTLDGIKYYICECGNSYSEKYADKTDHVYVISGQTAATCTEQGSVSYSCSCGASYSVALEANGHSYSSKTIPASCTSDGYTEYSCECGDTYFEKTADKIDHIYFIKSTEPATCTSEGFTEYLCSCGSRFIERSDKLEHLYIETTIPATCTENGFSVHTCNCGDSYTQTIEAKGHLFSLKVTKSTCTEEGYTTHICNCGYTYRDCYTSAVGHDWSKWTVSSAATTSRTGSQYRKCALCSKRETASIPKKTAVDLDSVTPVSAFQGVDSNAMEAVSAVLLCVDKYYDTDINDEIYLGVFELTRAEVTIAESAMVFYCGSYYDGFKCTTFYYIDENHHHLFVNIAVLRRAEKGRREMMNTLTEAVSGFEAGSREHLIDQVFNYLAENISYDESQSDATVALKTGLGSCNTYPILFKNMLCLLGIESEICIGYAYTGYYHAWNRINLDGGGYLYYDLTFYLSTHSSKYFAASSLAHDLCAVDRYLTGNEKDK